MFVTNNSAPSLARRPIHATPEMLDIAARNVIASRSWPRTIVATANEEFSTKLSRVTKNLAARKSQTQAVSTSASDESFAAKLSKATKARAAGLRATTTQKQHKEQSERERSRYPGYKRARTKSE